MQTPLHVWNQLNEGSDSQSEVQGLLGVVLALGTFPYFVAGSLWVDFEDRITQALAKGGGHNPVRNMHWEDLVASASQ